MRTQDGALAAPQTFGRSFVAAAATVLAALALAVGALAAAPSAAWAADDDIASGTCGSCDWVVDADGELTISPSSGTSGRLDYMTSASDVPWRPYRTQITSVVIEDGVQAYLYAVGLFQGFTSLVTADVSGLDASTENSYSIAYMFYGCTALESVNLDGLNTSGVENLSYLFYNCSSLKSLDLSSLETSCATDMDYMFYGCSSLESIDFSGFDASLAKYMQYMFYGCSSLTSLDLSGFEAMSVSNMRYMFEGCSSLRKLDLSTFEVDNCDDNDLQYVFEGCTGLRVVVLGAGYDFPSSYYDGYLPVPYDETYGYGLWQSDDGTIYEDPSDIPGLTAATYTAVFEVESGSGEYVPIWTEDAEDDSAAGDDASGDDGAAGDDASGDDGAAGDGATSGDDADDDAAADDDAVADDDSSADDGADADDSEGEADTVYEVVSGADQSIEEGDNLTVRVEVDSDKFHGSYEIDGNAASDCSWIARSNGTLSVVIDADILSELELGEHTLTLYFDDGYATTTFTIVAASDDASDGEESDSDENADTGTSGNAAGDDDASADDGADADDSTADSTASRTYFTDVPESASGKWYFDAVYALADAGYITGYDDGSYGVGDKMTRGQFVTILWRIACPDEYAAYDNDAGNESGLSDVADGKYYTAAVNWGVENEVVTGYSNGKFGVNDSMSFQDMCLVIARYADAEAVSVMSSSAAADALADFADTDEVSSYALTGMAWCVDEGLVSGNSDGTLDPQSKVTRERVATVLYRAIEEGLV